MWRLWRGFPCSFVRRRRPLQLVLLLLVVSVLLLLTVAVLLLNGHNDHTFATFHDAEGSIGDGCRLPTLQLWPDSIRRIYSPLPALNCSRLDWTAVGDDGDTLVISGDAVRAHGHINCQLTPVLRGPDDFQVSNGPAVTSVKNASRLTSDVTRVECTAADGSVYRNVHVTVLPTPQVLRSRVRETRAGVNILMFGFDSVSRMTWMRHLPRTYDYLVNRLDAVVLRGYNIVGDGTPQALLPILTGMSEPELPEARRGFSGAKPVDDHPWIWNALKDVGYVTQWGEDAPDMGTFTYRMLGFRRQPVDHYMRTYFIASNSPSSSRQRLCAGSEARHQVMMRYQRQLVDAYRPSRRLFSFVFHSEYTHGSSNLLQLADTDLLAHLRYLNDRGHLNRSLLVLMSDHGARFDDVRATPQGKLEERLPFMALRLPPSFSQRATDNLRLNADRLTTPYDLHATLLDAAGLYNRQPAEDAQRHAYSLFDAIPLSRSCSDARIQPHWCSCLQWKAVSVSQPTVVSAARHVVSVFNNMTSQHVLAQRLCTKLELDDVISAVAYVINDDVLRFRKSLDVHGRVPDMSDEMTTTEVLYQITFRTRPSEAIYDATVTHHVTSDKYDVSSRDVSRINRYGDEPSCIASQLPHLRPYCYCIIGGRETRPCAPNVCDPPG